MRKIPFFAISLLAVSAFAAGVVFKANPLELLPSGGGGGKDKKATEVEQLAAPSKEEQQVAVHKTLRLANAPDLKGVVIPRRFDDANPQELFYDFDYALHQNDQKEWSINEEQARLIVRHYPEVLNSRHAVKLRQMYAKAMQEEWTKVLQEKSNNHH